MRRACVVQGPTPLHGTRLDIPDIRAGCSYILAALCAEGESEAYGIEHIECRDEQLDEKLCSLGAQIEHVRPRPARHGRWQSGKSYQCPIGVSERCARRDWVNP